MMSNKSFFVLVFLCAGMANLAAAELSGTYDKDFKVTSEFNTVAKGKTLLVKKGTTFMMTDAIVNGNIVVEKGASFIAEKDGAGYLVFKKGTHVEGIDLYYKVRVSDELVFTRKIPITLDEVWKSKKNELIEIMDNMEFCYSTSLKGWISIGELRFVNPFNENLYEDYDMVFTKSVSKIIEKECRSLIVKNKSKVVIQPNPDVWGSKINESLIVEKGSFLLGTGPDGHKLQLKQGIKIEGLPVYVRVNNDFIPVDSAISDLWKLPAFSKDEYYTVYYNSDLKGWVFDNMISDKELTDSLAAIYKKFKKK